MRRTILIPAIAAFAALLTGCGSMHSGTTAPATRSAKLEIVIRPGLIANAQLHRYRLTCQPAGGNLPDPAAACAALARRPRLLDPLPNCSKVIPDTGSKMVTGSFAGRHVVLTFACPRGGVRWGKLALALGLMRPASG